MLAVLLVAAVMVALQLPVIALFSPVEREKEVMVMEASSSLRTWNWKAVNMGLKERFTVAFAAVCTAANI